MTPDKPTVTITTQDLSASTYLRSVLPSPNMAWESTPQFTLGVEGFEELKKFHGTVEEWIDYFPDGTMLAYETTRMTYLPGHPVHAYFHDVLEARDRLTP